MSDPLCIGKFPSRYQVECQLGEGALGEIFLANDLETNTKVVIKTLKRALAYSSQSGPINIRRFHNEFNALKHCVHPNIIKVFDFGEFNHTLYYTMEYLDGFPLSAFIPPRATEEIEELPAPIGGLSADDLPLVDSSPAPTAAASNLTLDEAIQYLFQIAQALYFIHERGLIHRDIKPDNVFVTKDKQIKLLDFGLARAEQTSVKLTISDNALGTPNYMAPEIMTNTPLDHLADIYSFGVLAFELLTKELPYQDKLRAHLAYKHALANFYPLILVRSYKNMQIITATTNSFAKEKTRHG